jgi:tetratricopeptide (TPR) repeat protein
MDIDEFLEAESDTPKEGGRQALVEKQSASFITGRTIEGQLEKVRDLIQQKRFQEAEKVYYVIKEQYSTMAKRQQEERRALHRQLTQINKELIMHLNKVKGEMEQKGLVITDLLMKARQYMQQGNIDKANQLYLEVRRIFKQMPDAFNERKMMLENQILMFYSQLINEFNRKKYDQLLGKRDEIVRHVEITSNFVRLGKIEEAKREYQTINNLYNQLPEGFLYEKTIIYKRILALYQMIEEGNIQASPPMEPLGSLETPQLNMGTTSSSGTPNTQKTEAQKAGNETKGKQKSFFGFMKKKTSPTNPTKTEIVEKKTEREMDAPPLPI